MRTIACVVLLVTGPDPACFASFSDSTEKLASAVVMPPIVIAMCIQDRKVLSFAEYNIRRSCSCLLYVGRQFPSSEDSQRNCQVWPDCVSQCCVVTSKLTKVRLGLNAEGNLARQLHLSPVCEVLGAKQSVSNILHSNTHAIPQGTALVPCKIDNQTTGTSRARKIPLTVNYQNRHGQASASSS